MKKLTEKRKSEKDLKKIKRKNENKKKKKIKKK